MEFLGQVFQLYTQEVHELLAETNLYNVLLFYMDHYPYHNILHAQITELFLTALDSEPLLNHLLYQTDLIKKILDVS